MRKREGGAVRRGERDARVERRGRVAAKERKLFFGMEENGGAEHRVEEPLSRAPLRFGGTATRKTGEKTRLRLNVEKEQALLVGIHRTAVVGKSGHLQPLKPRGHLVLAPVEDILDHSI